MTARPTGQDDTFEGRIADVRHSLRTAPPGIDRDNLLIELGVLVATQELTNPTIGLAHAIMVAQRTATCIPEVSDHRGDLDLADVISPTMIIRYGTMPPEDVRDMLGKGTLRKVIGPDNMVYGYLPVRAVPRNACNYQCTFCGKSFETESDYRRHVDLPGCAWETQDANELDQECKFCGKAFATLDELRRHQDVPGAACEEQYEQLYGGSHA